MSSGLVLIIVSIGSFMATLDASVVNVAIANITQEFSTNFKVTTWIVTAYGLSSTLFLLPFEAIRVY